MVIETLNKNRIVKKIIESLYHTIVERYNTHW